jgi:hypothetical protein
MCIYLSNNKEHVRKFVLSLSAVRKKCIRVQEYIFCVREEVIGCLLIIVNIVARIWRLL